MRIASSIRWVLRPVTGLVLALGLAACQQPLPVRPGPEEAGAPEVEEVWRIDAEAFGDEERLAAVCLQGLANRARGRVFLDYGKSLRWMQIDYDKDRGDQGGAGVERAGCGRAVRALPGSARLLD